MIADKTANCCYSHLFSHKTTSSDARSHQVTIWSQQFPHTLFPSLTPERAPKMMQQPLANSSLWTDCLSWSLHPISPSSLSHHNHSPCPWTFPTPVAQPSKGTMAVTIIPSADELFPFACWEPAAPCFTGHPLVLKAVISDMLPHQHPWLYKRLPPAPAPFPSQRTQKKASLRVLARIFSSGLLFIYSSTIQALR